MRDYYVKQIIIDEMGARYCRGYCLDLKEDMRIIVGDFNDVEYEKKYNAQDFMYFGRDNKICGYKGEEKRFGSRKFELVKYTPEFKELEKYIIEYMVTVNNLDKDRAIYGIHISDVSFESRWFEVEKNTIYGFDKMPVSIADYIINYAEAEDFSSDLNYVYIQTWMQGVLRFTLDHECRTLLSKLRLLR